MNAYLWWPRCATCAFCGVLMQPGSMSWVNSLAEDDWHLVQAHMTALRFLDVNMECRTNDEQDECRYLATLVTNELPAGISEYLFPQRHNTPTIPIYDLCNTYVAVVIKITMSVGRPKSVVCASGVVCSFVTLTRLSALSGMLPILAWQSLRCNGLDWVGFIRLRYG